MLHLNNAPGTTRSVLPVNKDTSEKVASDSVSDMLNRLTKACFINFSQQYHRLKFRV